MLLFAFNYFKTSSNCFCRPQTKFEKVMFLYLSASHSVNRGEGVRVWQGACMGSMHGRGACVAGEHAWGGGGCAWQGACVVGACVVGACVVGGMHGKGHVWWGVCGRGVCMVGGMHAMHAPRTLRDTVGQCAGGTHPTGMHSCFQFV